MKPDGITMETTEPTAEADPSFSQGNVPQQDPPPSEPQEAAGHEATCKMAKDPEVKPKAVSKKQPNVKNSGTSVSNPRPGTAPASMVNDAKSSLNRSAKTGVATKTSTTKVSVVGAVSKRPAGGAVASSPVKNQARVPDKMSGPARTTSAAATVTNGRRATASRRPAAETVNETRPKSTSAASRSAVTNAPKPSTSATSKTDGSGLSKTTRPVASRPASATSRPTKATTKPSTSVSAKTAAPRVTTAPSSGRATTVQSSKPTAVKDVCQPHSATVAKKPATSAAPKKPEASKAPATTKLNSASKKPISTQAADPKQSKTQDSLKLTKKPAVTTAQLRAINKQPSGRPPLALPVNKPTVSNSQAKKGLKPPQSVPPFTAIKKTVPVHSGTGKVQSSRSTPAAVGPPTIPKEAAVVLPQPSFFAASAPEEASSKGFDKETPQDNGAAWSPHSPERTTIPQMSPNHEQREGTTPPLMMQERHCAPVEVQLPEVASRTELPEPVYSLADCTPSTSKSLPTAAAPQMFPSANLSEEEDDEEEKEGSQLVSMSEMSGATQPTEESRPGSAGPLGGCAWRAGGVLLSELDSEEVSGSQQGASELSAPGVLEGTESIDDLGDGSLKGAMDIEGASAGSPDFEKVPDIPVNDFEEEEDDEDDYDRVCDMDVGSEQAEDPQRPRHDNDVDDEEDDDVEMASEGVTESGLESYGNADEDDFVEDERLDNLNRLAQLPPPPHLLPSAPAAQWNQQNSLVDPWAQPQQVLEVAGAVVNPFTDPWQADSETPTQSQAQAWLELGSISCVPENREVPHHSSVKHEVQNEASHMYMDQPSLSLMQTLAPAHLSAPGMSLSSTVSSETSTPEELGDHNQEKHQSPTQAAGVPVQHHQPEVEHKDLSIYLDGEDEAEAETLPADEILGGPTTASSSSVTDDEGSDTEGEVQLIGDSLDRPEICHTAFENQPLGQRCLSTVEEGEEAESEAVEGGAGEDFTLPSATSVTSGFDIMTSASNSNGQSTGESCTKSPGVFSLEELSEEAKEPCAVQQDHTQPSMEEQHYAEYGYQEAELTESDEEKPDLEKAVNPLTVSSLEHPDEIQPPCYKAICEQTDDSFAGFTALPYLHSREHSAYVRTYCDIVKPHHTAALTGADLPPRSRGQQAQSPQLRRLEQHQRQLQELQQRREQQSKPLEEVEQERKRREEEELRKKKDEAEEEIKRNEWQRQDQGDVMESKGKELQQRRELELQLQQQQEELKQRQQIMQWQQELQQAKGQTVLLSPSSGLCTIYEALENSEDEAEGEVEGAKELSPIKKTEVENDCGRMNDEYQDSSLATRTCPQRPQHSSEDSDASCCTPDSSERPPPLDLDWGEKVDIVQQLINQTLLLNGDGCSSLLLLPGGGGGTLSPLESSLWPNLLPPLTPPSATVTSVSSFSPEATGSSPQGEWTVVELETHH